jgi:hypothetical protein
MSKRASGVQIIRTGFPDHALRVFQRCGPRSVFIRELEKAVARIFIGAIADKTPTPPGLFAKLKLKRLRHAHPRSGSPTVLSAPAPEVLTGRPMLSALCPAGDSIRTYVCSVEARIGFASPYIQPYIE